MFQRTAVLFLVLAGAVAFATENTRTTNSDPRNIRTGRTIPDEGYCDQPYVVVTKDGNWLCTFTTGPGHEGNKGQHIVAAISNDQGRTWSSLIDIEPSDGPEASWAMPLITPGGRVYVFYTYNHDRINTLGKKKNIRADLLGWYVFKYSDDHGRTWSKQRYRLDVRHTEYDRINDFQGKVQMFWGVGKPIIAGGEVYFGFSKVAKHVVGKTEGWFFHSDNVLTEPDPANVRWHMLPEGDIGLRAPAGPIAEEHNIVVLSDGSLYTVYRSVQGYICHAYSRDKGKTWTPPAYAVYRPGGRKIKNPRACPRLWKTANGNYLLWYHNHGGKSYQGRNPAWITGGVEKDGRIHWAEPEILLYDPDHGDRAKGNRKAVRISYPDLIEQNGRYWITETQKTVARVHEIDPTLFEGLWQQERTQHVTTDGRILDLREKNLEKKKIPMPSLPDLRQGGGFSLDLWVRFEKIDANQMILDARDENGKGLALLTDRDGAVRLELSDDAIKYAWSSDPGAVRPGKRHHIVATVDGGPKIITFVIDGKLHDGGTQRQYGWGRFPKNLGQVRGADALTLLSLSDGRLFTVRIYDHILRTSQAVAHYHAATPSTR